jgi:hypothetical protein
VRSLNFAVFGEATYRFTDELSLTGGLRYTHDDLEFRHFRAPAQVHLRRVARRRGPCGGRRDSRCDGRRARDSRCEPRQAVRAQPVRAQAHAQPPPRPAGASLSRRGRG